jgi:16S rRNA (uracil1498-N3)-methyltransferase
MSKFFVNKDNIHTNHIIIKGEDVNHIKKVLRLDKNDIIVACDGLGKDYTVRILEIETDSILTEIISSDNSNTEPPVNITLYQGIPKGDKMDTIVQKSVELGAVRIVPIITERTIVRINGAGDSVKKITRWRRISLEAAKQCNRGIIPRVEFPMEFEKGLQHSLESDLCLIPYEEEINNGIKKYLRGTKGRNVSVFIGPEGGFSAQEIEKAESMGAKPVTLGPRILRTETAGIAILSIVMYELGDVGK